MANISITNPTILNSETADVTKLTQNDTDLVNGLTDGTKDINIAKATVTSIVNSGTLNNTGDIFAVAWTDYSAISTISGWASFTTKSIFYKKVGKLCFCSFSLIGTSTTGSGGEACSFSLPYSTVSSLAIYFMGGYGQDAGAALTSPPLISMNASSSTVTIYKTVALGAWTGTATTKSVNGSFWFETA